MKNILILIAIISVAIAVIVVADVVRTAPLVRVQADEWQRRSELQSLRELQAFSNEMSYQPPVEQAEDKLLLHFVPFLPIVVYVVLGLLTIVAGFVCYAIVVASRKQKQPVIWVKQVSGQYQYLLTDGNVQQWYDYRVPEDRQLIDAVVDTVS